MGIEQTMSIEDNYDLWVTDSWLQLFPFGFKSKFWWLLFMDLIQIVNTVIWTYFNIYIELLDLVNNYENPVHNNNTEQLFNK